MQAIRNILHFALILAILSTGLPFYHTGDANRDDRVDLADAILRVQGVARTAEQPAAFKENLEDALITLSAVAGVRKVIKADRGQAAQPNVGGLTVWVPNAGREAEFLPSAWAPAQDGAFLYRSPALTPLTPPPLSA
ncbi:MAG: hypothetical protein COS57_12525 [Syntrophobacterales bacterium CG03_land_8_20_14_0_80_58_14]|nr:MAG: hypothetical protein AUK26_11350 [Syntrophaceae bacterium CG2_30_58_14]PIV02335.1 MAG: hypothetical protein COS57_12525 [Syntrophobacterales bacterium CG03_land_8_20_14_0_80_58_14]